MPEIQEFEASLQRFSQARYGQWRTVDLHNHSPASHDFRGNKDTALDHAVAHLKAKSVDVVMFTDHHKLPDAAFVEQLTETMIHEPSDSWLLCDAMRIMVRLLDAAGDLPQAPAIAWHNHSRRAKRRAQAIDHCRKQTKRTMLYRDLIAVAGSTVGYLRAAAARVSAAACAGIEVEAWLASVGSWLPLVEQVIEQTERRVLKGETVPAAEKLVSLFEPHSDIIVKGGRDVHYGHKLNLTSGKSGMILDVVIEAGNPADAERLLPMLERHIDIYGRPPRQMAADGGYASGGNLKAAKEKGVRDMAFHKKRGLKIEDMVRSRWVYRKLRNFRAGIEAGISCLKRAYGLARCTWKGLAHFKAYVWSSVVAYNLALLARLKPA